MTQIRHYADSDVKHAVLHELRWMPSVNDEDITVEVTDGVVTLSGEVANYPEKLWAERAAQRVHGVAAVILQLTVGNAWAQLSDEDIELTAQQSLHRSVDIPDSVTATVENRIITLVGEVQWQWQRLAAVRSVQYLKGVDSVHNAILVESPHPPEDLPTSIHTALARNAQLQEHLIGVSTDDDGYVTLRGTVGSWAERRQAEHSCWAAPGVTGVDNQVRVIP